MVTSVYSQCSRNTAPGVPGENNNPGTIGIIEEPIFLLGFPRSGTTWLNMVLRDYLDIGLVNEGTFIIGYARRYQPTGIIRDIDHLVERLSRLDFFHLMHKIYGVSINWPEVLSHARGREYAYLIKLILADVAQQMDKRLTGSKNPGFGRNMELMLDHFPAAKFIHVIRDGRDCALSHYEMVWGIQNAYVVATRWRDYIGEVRQSVIQRPAHYLEMRYEDLLADPVEQFTRMEECIYAGCGAQRPGRAVADAFAASISDGAYEQRTGKWKYGMRERDKAIFESVAGEMLASLGYPLTGVEQTIPVWSRAWYVVSNRTQKEYWNVARKMSKSIGERKPRRNKL